MCEAKRHATREELQAIFGPMIDFPPEVDREASRRWLERGLADGSIQMVMDYVIYDGETGLPLITVKGVSLIDL